MDFEFEAVIGLEVHCQLATHTKIFCSCRARLSDETTVANIQVNSNTCPICAGHPGTLPVLNRKVVEYGIRVGLATHCQINQSPVFARKNYFYPDLPKGYQITQFDQPLCENGWLLVENGDVSRTVRIQRIHLEEDAGKSVHRTGFSLVNLNRAGVPLIEIVSEPDMKTPQEAGAYLRTLHSLVVYLEISDGNMQEGNFRCDANVSVMRHGSSQLGIRTEIKNLNSFRFIEKAIEYEISRQVEVIRSGVGVIQETRGYDSSKNSTFPMRSKEQAHDYRYFPDPDLLPVKIDSDWIEKIRHSLPELPDQKRARLMNVLGLSLSDAELLISSKFLVEFFDEVVQKSLLVGVELQCFSKAAANWMLSEVMRLRKEDNIELWQSQLRAFHIVDLVRLVQKQSLSHIQAKQVICIAWKTGQDVSSIVDQEGLKQWNDLSLLEPLMDEVIRDFPRQVAEYRAGKDKLLGFFIGRVMKKTNGMANPPLLGELLRKKLM